MVKLGLAEVKERYVTQVRSGDISVLFESRAAADARLVELGYEPHEGSFKHLTGMPIYTLTAEVLVQLKKERADLQSQLDALNATTPCGLWLRELDELELALAEYDRRVQGNRA